MEEVVRGGIEVGDHFQNTLCKILKELIKMLNKREHVVGRESSAEYGGAGGEEVGLNLVQTPYMCV